MTEPTKKEMLEWLDNCSSRESCAGCEEFKGDCGYVVDTIRKLIESMPEPEKPKVTREQRNEVAQYVHRIGCVEYHNRSEGHVQDMNTIPNADCIIDILGLEVED
jgi:hypothetical protein